MSQLPETRRFGQPLFDEVAHQMLEEQFIDDTERRMSGAAAYFIGQPQGELVKCKEVKIEQRQPMIDGQHPPESVEDRLGRSENRNLCPGIGCFQAPDLFDERGFEGGMEPAGDNL